MKTARSLLTTRVVTVKPDQRLTDVAPSIVASDALYCAVVEDDGKFLGLVRFKEVVARSANRIFADLVPSVRPIEIEDTMEASAVVKLLRYRGVDELVVLAGGEKYVGLVTRESVFEWWVTETKAGLSRAW